jgi:hypothetical protein
MMDYGKDSQMFTFNGVHHEVWKSPHLHTPTATLIGNTDARVPQQNVRGMVKFGQEFP